MSAGGNPRVSRRRSSLVREVKLRELKDLPALKETPANKREDLFVQKLDVCAIKFDFENADPAHNRGKDMKRETLLELVDFVNNAGGQKIFGSQEIMSAIMECVGVNLCRALRPQTEDFDPEEDEPVLEASWPHLQVMYEFFLRFVVSSEVNAKVAKKHVDQTFCLKLVELFDSEDPRERDYLKTILHRIYGKFMSHRSFIRKTIQHTFYRFIFESERHNGIAELLEILGSIINGFAIPLKREHLNFLQKALVPLHKPKCVNLYHQQLSYCVTQYVEKDPATAVCVVTGLIKFWPWGSSSKVLLFLNELEEIMELIDLKELTELRDPLFKCIAQCLSSEHFQVAERTLFLWNNEHLVNVGCLSREFAEDTLPIIYGPLFENSTDHWNNTVQGLAENVLKLYMDIDVKLFNKCSTSWTAEETKKKAMASEDESLWALLPQEDQSSIDSSITRQQISSAQKMDRQLNSGGAGGGSAQEQPKT